MSQKQLDKNEILASILAEMASRIRESETRLSEILRRANEAPGAMESHSDTDKNQWGRQAAGQRETVESMKLELTRTEALTLDAADIAEIGSLVEVQEGKSKYYYFLLPGGGGVRAKYNGSEVVAVTPATPLGAALLGKKKGEGVNVAHRTLTILHIY